MDDPQFSSPEVPPWGLASYYSPVGTRAALTVKGVLLDLEALAAEYSDKSGHALSLPSSTMGILEQWDSNEHLLADLAEFAITETQHDGIARPLAPPVPRPGKVLNFGLNFHDHAAEMGIVIPEKEFAPNVFFKGGPECLVGHMGQILPSSRYVDWEAEPAVIIGRAGRNIPEAHALDHVAGFTCHNDVTDRRAMLKKGGGLDFFAGKSRDTFGPLGPALIPRGLVADPDNLQIRCLVNGEVMQDTSTSQMIWDTRRCISYVSGIATLMPGDVIALGTGAGVGWAIGVSEPKTLDKTIANLETGGGIFLASGDRVIVEIKGVGTLENKVGDLDE